MHQCNTLTVCFPIIFSTRRRMPVSTEAVNEFNFGSSILDSQPCVISINIENKGASATVW